MLGVEEGCLLAVLVGGELHAKDGNFAFFDFGMKVQALVVLQLTSGVDGCIQQGRKVLGMRMEYFLQVLVGGWRGLWKCCRW